MNLVFQIVGTTGSVMIAVVGLAIILGLMNVINLAQTGLMAVGVYGAVSATTLHAPFWFAVLAGAVLAGLVGAGASPIYSVDPNVGFSFLIPAFVVVVIGGLGSFWGAVIAGLLVGELQSITTIVQPAASDVVIYVAMALVLLVRPAGLLGESEVIRG